MIVQRDMGTINLANRDSAMSVLFWKYCILETARKQRLGS